MEAKAPLHRLLLGCWLGLLLLLAAPLVLSANASVGAWLMQTVPLLLTLPGLLKLNSRVLLWLAFLVLFYFVNGVLQAASAAPVQRWLGALTVLLCLTVFTAVIVVVRRGRTFSRQATPQSTSQPAEPSAAQSTVQAAATRGPLE